ncbi:MAG: modification methylase [Epulopiscium sp. Nuni2H_MBin003]|nr:MAG: modification methylase [Epulopiscium sp. Nuni2H_MBin003]
MNYIGSKYSLLDFICTTVENVTGTKNGAGRVFADLFAGTGVVGATFKKKGYKIIANDLQYYSYVLNKHNIENSQHLDKNLVEYLNKLEGVEGFIYNNYCAGSGSERNYFTDYNGKKCDSIRMELKNLFNIGQINEDVYYYYLASLINSVDKFANTASVYGAFLKHIKKSAQKPLELELLPIIQSDYTGEVYNQNANDLIGSIKGDILYLDPPYNARQYCANYHLLETIAKYDNPQIRGKTGLRQDKMQKSLYCSKKTAAENFDALICQANFKYIFLSYNNEGLMGLDNIKDIMTQYGEYSVFTQEYKRFVADKNREYKAKYTEEYIHCLLK